MEHFITINFSAISPSPALEERQAGQRWVLLPTFPLTLSDLCHHLIYYKGGEAEKERPHEGKREAHKERQHKASNSAFSLVATAQ